MSFFFPEHFWENLFNYIILKKYSMLKFLKVSIVCLLKLYFFALDIYNPFDLGNRNTWRINANPQNNILLSKNIEQRLKSPPECFGVYYTIFFNLLQYISCILQDKVMKWLKTIKKFQFFNSLQAKINLRIQCFYIIYH